MSIICKYCNKEYKTYSSRSNHIKRFHTPKSTIQSTKPPPITLNADSKNKYVCKFCNNNFSRSDSLKRHYDRCKEKKDDNELKKENDLLREQNLKIQQEFESFKKEILQMMNKQCKVHPKTLQKINKQLNITNNDNKVINNTINLISLGKENLSDVLTEKQQMAILNQRFFCLDYMVKYIHFNDKFPQFKNILITNTQNKIAWRYNDDENKFLAVNKDDLLESVIDNRISDITGFYEQLEDKLDDRTKTVIEKFLDKMENSETYKEMKKKDIKLIIYNNRDNSSKEITQDLEIIV